MGIPCEAGDVAPDFSLGSEAEKQIKLQDFRGKTLALYFYPKDDTSGCTAEAIAFNGLRADFAKAGAAILGVSPDSDQKSREIQSQAWAGVRSRRRRGEGGRDRLWRLGREKHVRAQIYGRRALDFPDRARRARSPGSGARSRFPAMPRRCSPPRGRCATQRPDVSRLAAAICEELTLMEPYWRRDAVLLRPGA